MVPEVASFSGELDGLNRISRMAESFHFVLKNVRKGVERMTYLVPGKIYFISFLRKALFNNFFVIVDIVLKFSPNLILMKIFYKIIKRIINKTNYIIMCIFSN